jgi:hypothetical protein
MHTINNFNDGRGNFQFFTIGKDSDLRKFPDPEENLVDFLPPILLTAPEKNDLPLAGVDEQSAQEGGPPALTSSGPPELPTSDEEIDMLDDMDFQKAFPEAGKVPVQVEAQVQDQIMALVQALNQEQAETQALGLSELPVSTQATAQPKPQPVFLHFASEAGEAGGGTVRQPSPASSPGQGSEAGNVRTERKAKAVTLAQPIFHLPPTAQPWVHSHYPQFLGLTPTHKSSIRLLGPIQAPVLATATLRPPFEVTTTVRPTALISSTKEPEIFLTPDAQVVVGTPTPHVIGPTSDPNNLLPTIFRDTETRPSKQDSPVHDVVVEKRAHPTLDPKHIRQLPIIRSFLHQAPNIFQTHSPYEWPLLHHQMNMKPIIHMKPIQVGKGPARIEALPKPPFALHAATTLATTIKNSSSSSKKADEKQLTTPKPSAAKTSKATTTTTTLKTTTTTKKVPANLGPVFKSKIHLVDKAVPAAAISNKIRITSKHSSHEPGHSHHFVQPIENFRSKITLVEATPPPPPVFVSTTAAPLILVISTVRTIAPSRLNPIKLRMEARTNQRNRNGFQTFHQGFTPRITLFQESGQIQILSSLRRSRHTNHSIIEVI